MRRWRRKRKKKRSLAKRAKKKRKKLRKKIIRRIKKKHRKKARKTKKKIKKPKKHKKVTKRPKIMPVKITLMPDEKIFFLMKKSRIAIPKQEFCKKENQLKKAIKKIGLPCIMKVSGKKILKRTETSEMKEISSKEQAFSTFKQMKKMKKVDKIILQEKITGLEMILGAKQDPNFGYIISVAIGGKYSKLIKEISFRIYPVNKEEAANMLTELKSWSSIDETRKINIDSLTDYIIRLGKIAIDNKIKQIEADVFCTKEKCFAVDAKAIVK